MIMATWRHEIPTDIWWLILKRLTLTEHVRFSGVCKLWRSMVMDYRSIYIPTHVPGLVIPDGSSSSRFLAHPVGKNMDQNHDHHLPVLSIPHKHSCRGSYQGWLFIVTDTRDVYLHNPLNDAWIQLPPLTDLRRSWNVKRAILSSSPSATSECLVVVFWGSGYIFFCKVGDSSWEQSGPNWGCVNGIFYNQKFYLVDARGEIVTCPFISRESNVTVPGLRPPTTADSSSKKRYLVELDSELLQLVRLGSSLAENTKFEVFRLETSKRKWNEVKDLNGGAIFIGTNQSFALPRSNLTVGYKGDRIYFTDDFICDEYTCMIFGQDPYLQSPAISGVFLVGDDKSEPLYSTDSRTTRQSPPIWITPMPW